MFANVKTVKKHSGNQGIANGIPLTPAVPDSTAFQGRLLPTGFCNIKPVFTAPFIGADILPASSASVGLSSHQHCGKWYLTATPRLQQHQRLHPVRHSGGSDWHDRLHHVPRRSSGRQPSRSSTSSAGSITPYGSSMGDLYFIRLCAGMMAMVSSCSIVCAISSIVRR